MCNQQSDSNGASVFLQVYNPQIRANSHILRPISRDQADMRRQRVNSHLPGNDLRPGTSAAPSLAVSPLWTSSSLFSRLVPPPLPSVSV